jgi:hypothetical protein
MSSGSAFAFAFATDSTGGISSVMGSYRRHPTNRFAPCSPMSFWNTGAAPSNPPEPVPWN